MIVFVINFFRCGPDSGIAFWLGMNLANLRQPLCHVGMIKFAGIEGAEDITANRNVVLERKCQLRLELQIRPDVDITKRQGIRIEVSCILAGIARLEANLIDGLLIQRRAVANPEFL